MDPIRLDDVEPPANVLLVHDRHCSPDGCQLLREVAADVPTAELQVTFATDEPPYPGPADPEQSVPDSGKKGVVSVGDVLRSGSDAGPDFSAPVAVDAVSDPTDLSAIGVAVSRFCEQWGPGDELLTLCFHSLDALLRHTDPETVFEFTYYLNKRLSSVDALAHFHLDPAQHQDSVVATFGDIFDDVIVDGSAGSSMPEATDEDVARQLADGGRDEFAWLEGVPDEATDEEIDRLLG